MSSPFNPFYDRYLAPRKPYRGVKRKREEMEVVIPSSYQPSQKRVKYQESQAQNTFVFTGSKAEVKGMDTSIAQVVPASTGTNASIDCVNLVQAGSGSFNRVGRKIKNKSLRLKGTVQCVSQLTGGDWLGNSLRCIVVYDAQPSGATPTFADIFSATNQSGVEASEWSDPPKYDNMNRFKVLKDWTYDFNPQSMVLANADQTTQVFAVDCFLPLLGLTTVFSGQNSPMTIADISSGALYFIARANNASVASQCNTDLLARLRYEDV